MNNAQWTVLIWFALVFAGCICAGEFRIRVLGGTRNPIVNFLGAHIVIILLYLMPLMILLAGSPS